MKNATARQTRPGSPERGVALVLVLAFIVLLSILVVSFIAFSRLNGQSTVSYATSIQAQEIAQGGLQDILGDLHSEIIAGSVVLTNNSSTYPPVYLPITNYTAAPARLGYTAASFSATPSTTTLPSTVVRVSRASQDATPTDLYPLLNTSSYYTNIASVPGGAIPNRASAAHTSTPASNGRYISAARWNAPFLMAATTGTSTGGAGLQIPSNFANNMPDWVYVTRAGSRACQASDIPNMKPAALGTTPPSTTTASTVVGRYAYVVYDEGALLDANVAGATTNAIGGSVALTTSPATPNYASSTPPAFTNVTSGSPPMTNMLFSFPGKSYTAMADLSALASGFTPPKVDAFVKLRNAGGIANAGTSNGNPFLSAVFSYSQTGFLKFSTASAGPSDSPLLSRQDLINYFANVDGNKFNTASASASQALPFLGTFSRTLCAPTWSPQINSNKDINYVPSTVTIPTAPLSYKDIADTSTLTPFSSTNPNPNRDLANLRWPGTAQITHYFDDPTVAVPTGTYTVAAGDPMLQTRFSLAKIAWLSQSWAGQTDPSNTSTTYATSAYPAAIQACFGLVWGTPGTGITGIGATSGTTANGGNPCWNYAGSPLGPGGTSKAKVGVIETLDQVALENREPNFFELLKAAILSGSLGLGPGNACFGNQKSANDTNGSIYNGEWSVDYVVAPANKVGTAGLFGNMLGTASKLGPPSPATIPDMQIMQIGANIIDQFDSDSFPTAIYFPYLNAVPNGAFTGAATKWDPVVGNGNGLANALLGPVTMVYGDENLPLLSKIEATYCCPDAPNNDPSTLSGQQADGSCQVAEAWLQPELWNPHQQPATVPAQGPVSFEIRAYGASYVWGQLLQYDPAGVNYLTYGSYYYTSVAQSHYHGVSSSEGPTNSADSQAGTLLFNVNYSNGFPFANTPRLLTEDQPMVGEPSVTVDTTQGDVFTGTSALTSYAQANFPFYNTAFTVASTAAPTYTNHFAAFPAGIMNSTATPTHFHVSTDKGPTDSPPSSDQTHWNTGLVGEAVPAGQAWTLPSPGAYPYQCMSFALGWCPTGNPANFHPYSFINGVFIQTEQDKNFINSNFAPKVAPMVGAVLASGSQNFLWTQSWGLPDPRTARFSHSYTFNEQDANTTDFASASVGNTTFFTSVPMYYGSSPYPSMPSGSLVGGGAPTNQCPSNFVAPMWSGSGNWGFPQNWVSNSKLALNAFTAAPPNYIPGDQRTLSGYVVPSSAPGFYADPDGVIRPGDGCYVNVNSGDGNMLFTDAGKANETTPAVGDKVTSPSQHGRRPVILNRPFRSVGELGYTFRGEPFKTLDLFSASSADAALLDVFSTTDQTRIVPGSVANAFGVDAVMSGQVSLNNSPVPVLTALLSVSAKKDLDPTYYMSAASAATDASQIANAIATQVNLSTVGGGPLLNRSNLATSLGPVIHTTYANGALNPPPEAGNKTYLEAPVRALSDVTNTRTWNLMIDVIAQAGQISPAAQPGDTNALSEFIVEGEKRYWLHIAIDRYTGKIVDQQLEPVYE